MLDLRGTFEDTAFSMPSETLPNQSLTVSEVMKRFAAGIPANQVAQAFYEDELDEGEINDELANADSIDVATSTEQGSDIVDLSEMSSRS